jgi:putative endonuclease
MRIPTEILTILDDIGLPHRHPSLDCPMSYYVYILSNKRRTVFYTGITNNLPRRISEHKAGRNHGFSWQYNCHEILYFEEYSSVVEAIAREKVLKKFRRHWKFQLIRAMNPGVVDLSKEW